MSQSSATSTESEGISLAGDSVQRVVVIGAGECAARFVTTLRELGYEGSIVLLGDEGLAPYERPPLSKQTLLESPTPNPVVALSEERLRALNVSFDLSDCAVSVDRSLRQVVTRNSATYTYDRLLFATGAKSRPLPFDGAKHALMLRTHREALLLREALQPGTKVAVIGGGFIGLEVAASARSLGCDVTVIEVADRLMGRAVPIEIAALMEQRHHDEGVQFILGVGVESIELTTNDHPYDVHLSNGSTLQADLVLAGIGAIPETTIAAECELAVDNGIAADQHLRTSDPFIYAAGDCVSFPHPLYGDRRMRLETWQNAHDHAVVAATNVFGGSETAASVPWFWSDQYDLTLQVAGLAFGTTQVLRTRADGVVLHFSLDTDGRLLSAASVAEGSTVARDIRLAKMLIAQRSVVSPELLADANVGLKSLLSEHARTS
jgi:3-phenylpropionate/trans-cinnamate dioxygenase ferredoxin reductase component